MHSLPRLHLAAPPWVFELLAHLWQSTAVGLAILVLLVLCGRLSARTRHLLGWIALAKFMVPAAWLVRLAEKITNTPVTTALIAPMNFSSDARVVGTPGGGWSAPEWLWPVFSIVWIVGSAVLIAGWVVRGMRLRRQLLADARPVSAAVERNVADAAGRVGLRTVPRCVIVESTQGPGAVGVRSPILILPQGLAETLSRAELEAILIHECVHLQRRDNLWNALRAAFVSLLWFNPIAWLLNRAIGIETEKSCDERVLAITGDADTYANSIVASVRHTLGVAQPGWSAVTTPPVLGRTRNILALPARSDRPMARWAAVLAAVGLVALGGRAGSPAAVASTAKSPLLMAANAPERAGQPAAASPKEATLSVDFPDEDIRNILRNVAALFQLNIMMPETLQGKMTIKLRDATWRQIFKVVLEPTGFTFVEEQNIIRIFHRDSPPPRAPKKVGTITIKFGGAGNVNANEQEVRAKLQIREGGDFDEILLDRDIRTLYRTGVFETIEIKHEAVNPTTFNLHFELTPKPRSPTVQAEGDDAPPGKIGTVEEELSYARKKIAEANERLKRLREERAAMLARQKELDEAIAREAASKNPPATSPTPAPADSPRPRENAGLRPVISAPIPPPPTVSSPIYQGMKVFEVEELDRPPVTKFQARPRYPFEMRRNGVAGEAVIDFIVDTNGDVVNARAVRSSREEFEAPALAAVSRWKYKPGQKGGRDVPTHLQVPVIFTLNEE